MYNRVALIYSVIFFIIHLLPLAEFVRCPKKEGTLNFSPNGQFYPANMVLGISRGIKIEEITQKRKICITFSIFILVILFPQPNFFVVCLKYLHSQKLKILENYQIYSKMLFLKVINKG